MLGEELHIHLYGCFTAKDLWTLGKTRWKEQEGRLAWYTKEYEKAWGRTPRWEAYWTEEEGFELLKNDYLVKEGANFERFQAAINLVIALFPMEAEDDFFINYIFSKYKNSPIKYVEFRQPIGLRFSEDGDAIDRYLTMLSKTALDFEKKHGFVGRFAISLPRENNLMAFQYDCIKRWQKHNPDLSKGIVAVDFCGFEDSSPDTKKDFFKDLHKDNAKDPKHALAILYHVGESFENIGIEESINWVLNAHRYGAHRLGHCISVGVDPSEVSSSKSHEDLWKLQEEAMKELKSKNAVIESCPLSNLRIGAIQEPRNHPLIRFLKNGMKVVLSSDDPGVFDSSLEKELEFATSSLNLSKEDIQNLAKNAQSSYSPELSGRL